LADLRKYNHEDYAGMYIGHFNCGGFALGTFDWYEPWHFEDIAEDDELAVNEALEILTKDILHDFPHLIRVPHYRGVPKRLKVIGFRLDVATGEWREIADFHFIVRYHGKWYEKMGPHEIRRMRGNVEEPWGGEYGYCYDTDIVWFVDPTNRLHTNYQDDEN
jgi:hypothetical protein